MDLTKGLRKEHGLIIEGLFYLGMARDKIVKNEPVKKSFFEMAIKFFRNYADKVHHYKEEYLMFSFLALKKEGQLDLEIGSLRHQHERGREFINRIEKSLKGYAIENEIAITALLENLSSFVSVLSRHVYREDHIFFPMVEKDLTQDEKAELLKQFEIEDKSLDGEDSYEENSRLLKEMKDLVF